MRILRANGLFRRDLGGLSQRFSGAVALGCALALLLAASCGVEQGHPPVARAFTTPANIPENDNFRTSVTLDGTESADPADDADQIQPLEYHWRISGDEFRFEQGDASSVAPVVVFNGDRPATIELTVTDTDGLSATVSLNMQLTVTP